MRLAVSRLTVSRLTGQGAATRHTYGAMTTDTELPPTPLQVAVVTLGCARNEVDSEELAGRLEAGGFVLVADAEDADTVVVNTCGFVEAAKKDSVDTLLEAADLKARPGTVGAPRPSSRSAASRRGTARTSPSRCPRPTRCSASTTTPTSRPSCARSWRGRPTTPTRRPTAAGCCRSPRSTATPRRSRSRATRSDVADVSEIGAGAPATGPRAVRRRLDAGPMAPLKLASGCDRRCSFCAIPSFRGSFVSRRPSDVLQERRSGSPTQGVKELFLVSENSTSYGKDLGDLRLLETLLPELSGIDGIERVRVSYLQPAETRPGLIEAIATRRASSPTSTCPSSTPAPPCCAGCAASATPRASSTCSSGSARWPRWPAYGPTSSSASPARPTRTSRCSATSSRPPGWTSPACSATPTRTAPRRPASPTTSSWTRTRSAPAPSTSPALVEELNAQRAEERIGEEVVVLVEAVDEDGTVGRAAHQGPEVDGTTLLADASATRRSATC